MTAIEWTDETWNPIRASSHEHGNGWHCERVSRGCQNCYAEVINRDRFGTGLAYTRANRERVIISIWGTTLSAPLRWRKPRRIFVCSMTDLFGEWVPFELIDWVFAVMALAPQHTYQVLTKRPERMREYLVGRRDWAIPNLWLGVSVEDQVAAESRIPVLLDTPAAVRFLSCEPILSMVDLTRFLSCEADCEGCRREILGSDSAGHVLGGSRGSGLEARTGVQWEPAGSPADYLAGRSSTGGEGQRRWSSAPSVHGASRENAGLRASNRVDGAESRGHSEPDGSEPYRRGRDEQPSGEPRSDYEERERQTRAACAGQTGESEHARSKADASAGDRDSWTVRQPLRRPEGNRQDVRSIGRDDSEHRASREVDTHSRLISWVIVGGESGPDIARPCDIGWIRGIVGQCKAAAVPVFVKQLGRRPYDDIIAAGWAAEARGYPPHAVPWVPDFGANWAPRLRSRKGGDPSEWPEDLRVREWPR